MENKKRLLLISNSQSYGSGFLEHVKEEIKDFLKDIDSVLFIPYALADKEAYTKKARNSLQDVGLNLESIHKSKDPIKALAEAKAIFAGGGNTFRLLDELYKKGLVDLLKQRVEEGIPYIGSSAGANIASPTIKTTNDMPIVQPSTFNALSLITFQINPHYIDPDPNSKHMGETREKRIQQFHEENEIVVLGLRENTWLRIENSKIILAGKNGARLFVKGKKPKECKAGEIKIR